ncbi:MAG: hypothetical protein QOE70_686 [Chthoniobacter sp.]|nr:hypothetical protein [Chthoniobacter sp.]
MSCPESVNDVLALCLPPALAGVPPGSPHDQRASHREHAPQTFDDAGGTPASAGGTPALPGAGSARTCHLAYA